MSKIKTVSLVDVYEVNGEKSPHSFLGVACSYEDALEMAYRMLWALEGTVYGR